MELGAARSGGQGRRLSCGPYRPVTESLGNLAPADVYFGRAEQILKQREGIKRKTMLTRRVDMIAPDGTTFSNRMDFVRIEPSRLIEFVHGEDIENDPDAFRMLVTFDDQVNGKTAVTLRQMHPAAERRAIVIGFGAIEYGTQTWDKFAEFAATKAAMSTAVD